jgi:adenylate kinase family enzyme
VIYLKADLEVLEERLTGRWVHIPSGRVYHTIWNPPLVAGYDDVTGDELVRRESDEPENVKERLEKESNWANSLINHYEKCSQCDTLGDAYFFDNCDLCNQH